MIVTTATLATQADIEALAPIWQDAQGVKYRVSSGHSDDVPEGTWTPESEGPAPVAPSVVAGLTGLEALTLMGLVPLEHPDE
jgi:hypothetical protein